MIIPGDKLNNRGQKLLLVTLMRMSISLKIQIKNFESRKGYNKLQNYQWINCIDLYICKYTHFNRFFYHLIILEHVLAESFNIFFQNTSAYEVLGRTVSPAF